MSQDELAAWADEFYGEPGTPSAKWLKAAKALKEARSRTFDEVIKDQAKKVVRAMKRRKQPESD